MPRTEIKDLTLLDAVTVASNGSYNVSDFKHVVLAIAGSAAANLTVKIKGGIGTSSPDFTADRSASNMWDFIECVDLEDGAAIDGDTGVALSPAGASVQVRLVEVNVNALDWFAVNATAIVAGAVTVKATISDNG